MATTDRTDATAHADAVAGRLSEATFAALLARADGESLAAAGLLADACVSRGTPYQVSVVRTRDEFRSRRDAVDQTATAIPLGTPGEDGLVDRPSVAAFEAADALGAEPDPVLALAGVVASEATPDDAAPGIVERADVERRAGLATPTTDPADALAHTTLAHADYSGDRSAVEDVVAGIGVEDADGDDGAAAGLDDGLHRRLASLLAIDAVSADGATERAAHAVERAIHPLAGGPLVTVEGYADVLCALAATAPGRGVALALGDTNGRPVDVALDAWRAHAVTTHEAVRSAETERHGGLLVARTDGPVEAVARLLRDFRSPEPAVLAIRRGVDGPGEDDAEDGTAEAALATVDAPAEPIEAAAADAGGSGLASANGGYARFDGDRTATFVDAVRGAI